MATVRAPASESDAASALAARQTSTLSQLSRASWPISVVFIALLIAAWELGCQRGLIASYILPPSEIVRGAYDYFGDLMTAIKNTLVLAFRGLAFGAVFGLLIGLACGVNRMTEGFVEPVVGMTYPIPKIAIFPAIAIWLGYSDTARILLISIACFYPVYVASYSGAKGVAHELVWVAQNAGVSRFRAFFSVILPAALPRILVGLRIALVVSFLVTFAVELLTAGSQGIANTILLAEQGGVYEIMWGGIFLFGVVAVICERSLYLLGRWFTRGQSLAVGGYG